MIFLKKFEKIIQNNLKKFEMDNLSKRKKRIGLFIIGMGILSLYILHVRRKEIQKCERFYTVVQFF